jgi:preprotein translocase subunit SecD
MRRKYLVALLTTVILTIAALATVLALQYRPKLGLDLQGGASVVLQPDETKNPTRPPMRSTSRSTSSVSVSTASAWPSRRSHARATPSS